MKGAKYAIVENTERFSYTKFAVVRRLWVFWETVYRGDSIQECREYIAEATKLPEYYAENGEKI